MEGEVAGEGTDAAATAAVDAVYTLTAAVAVAVAVDVDIDVAADIRGAAVAANYTRISVAVSFSH
jgi:hypothetical protein